MRCLLTALAVAALFLAGPVRAQTEPDFIAHIHADGSVEFGGVRYTDTEILKAKLVETAKRQPQPAVLVRADADTKGDLFGKIVTLLHTAGLTKIGFTVMSDASPVADRPQTSIKLEFRADKSITLDGRPVTLGNALKSGLDELVRRNPQPRLEISAVKGSDYETIALALKQVQDAGLKTNMTGVSE